MRKIRTAVAVCIALFSIFIAGCSESTSASTSGLIISEVVTSDSTSVVDSVLGKPDWIELCNTTSSAIDLLNYSIAESKNQKYTFPDKTIKPGEYMLVYFCAPPEGSSSDKLCTGFKLSKNGVNLILSSSNGIIQQLEVPALAADVSYGLTSDGKYSFFASPTPGAANTTQHSDSLDGLKTSTDVKLKINEVMPRSASATDPYGWAEIYNADSKAVELSNYYLSEDPSNPTKARLPKKQLDPGAYAVVKFTGETGDGKVSFKINKTETNLILSNNFGSQIDKLSWDANIVAGISVGHGDNNSAVYFVAPTPGAKNGTDFLKSIKFGEGTGDIRINEILLKNKYSITDSDGDRSPWVELYNTTGAAVSLSGYSLSDNKDELMKWSLPDVSINANSYLVVFLSGKNKTTGNELHTNFKLGSEDTTLCLTNIKKGTVQSVTLPTERKDNVSYGLSSDGKWLYFYQPTPNAANDSKGFTNVADIITDKSGLKVNEVVSVNPARSPNTDWVEIYNSSSASVKLAGYYLSDSASNLKKWPLSGTDLKAGGYDVVDSYKNGNATSPISVSQAGETLYISNSNGQVVDAYDTGVLRPGYSSGLKPDGKRAIFNPPTKGAANNSNTVQGYCSEPVFSEGGGHKDGPVTLTITCPTKDAQVYYTEDGSTPDGSSNKYTGPLPINKPSGGVTVKAIALKSGMMDSDLTVATYLFDKAHKLPVICLSIKKSDLDYVFGSSKRNDVRERLGYAEYYDGNGNLGVKFPAGLKIAGNGTRMYKQRSINLYLRGAYGQSSVTYPFFDGYKLTNFKSISLRNMGGQQDPSRMRDVYISDAVNGMNINNSQSKFAAVYINGDYWGLYEFKENLNEDYFVSKDKVDKKNVAMVRGNKWSIEGSQQHYTADSDMLKLLDLAKKDMSNADNWKTYTSLTDSDYFMDYLIAETFFGCYDTYNQKYAHTKDNTLKWQPIFYDFDMTFSSASKDTFFLMKQASYTRAAATSAAAARSTDLSLFNAYYKNSEWKDKFVERYAYVLNNILTTDKLMSTYNNLVDSVKDEIPRTIDKWNMPSSVGAWNDGVSSIKSVIQNRRANIIRQLKSEFNLSDDKIKELFPNG